MPLRLHALWVLLAALLLGAPISHALSMDCCAEPGRFAAAPAEAADNTKPSCCAGAGLPSDGDQPPAERDNPGDGGCDCPLRCCTSGAPASVQLPPEAASQAPRISVRAAAPGPASAEAREPSLDLMRPPRS